MDYVIMRLSLKVMLYMFMERVNVVTPQPENGMEN